MIVVGRKPLYWFLIKRMFPHASLEKQIFAVGNTIYAPTPLPPDLVAHEETHLKQMHHSNLFALVWWIHYWWDASFRYRMELEACRVQMRAAMDVEWNIDKLNNLADRLAKNISSNVYNNCIDYETARREVAICLSNLAL